MGLGLRGEHIPLHSIGIIELIFHYHSPFQATEKPSPEVSFCTENLERHNITPNSGSEMEDTVKNVAGIAFVGGTDTTVSAVLSFILAMVLFPDVQSRAQKELDQIIGSGRLPDFADRDSLPYIKALILEVLRWNPAGPMAVAHHSINDDVYDGYFIPAGTAVIGNAWAILHDKELYGADPLSFKPERFLQVQHNGSEIAQPSPPDPKLFAFGFGRRICPGRYLALNTLYLTITYVLSTFTITKAVDEKGNEITPEVDYMEGMISQPRPFQCNFVPRSNEVIRRLAVQ
ncbi:hypothetical protein PM082_019211 [Marasmius tenuissimus]|nr:hypothetical protein PM082_019211 [Marasmius tenuissimus]